MRGAGSAGATDSRYQPSRQGQTPAAEPAGADAGRRAGKRQRRAQWRERYARKAAEPGAEGSLPASDFSGERARSVYADSSLAKGAKGRQARRLARGEAFGDPMSLRDGRGTRARDGR